LGFWDERNDLLRMPARYNMRIKNWRKMGEGVGTILFLGRLRDSYFV
jgi:hypothetical protein